MSLGRTICVLGALLASAAAGAAQVMVHGVVFDPAGRGTADARIEFVAIGGQRASATAGEDGKYSIDLPCAGGYTARAEAPSFSPVSRSVNIPGGGADIELHLERVAATAEKVVVNAEPDELTLAAPDPSQKVMVREELLDANPGRPGAPVSIPGLPIETASGGIKAPQYFVPGVAGDHGEPIAQYIAVGDLLLPNNLSANAHGNGYADPNIIIPAVLGSVATDGGAFNVLEGNHSLNLAATYSFRPRLAPFATLTSDYRDLDFAAGLAPKNGNEWLAVEAGFGNGLWQRLEHRRQYKWNAMRNFSAGNHVIVLFSVGYFGSSFVGGLVPLGMAQQLNDTLDPRQRDQTHTTIFAANDHWKAGASDEVSFSGFFRTYNLSLDSNFGEGLIRQSEFRTVAGAEARETHAFAPWLRGMAGVDYNEDDPRRDNLDHYLSGDAQIYGAFVKVLSNDLAIRDLAPYAAIDGDLGRHLRFYAGLRPDRVGLVNQDLLRPGNSFDLWRTIVNPKATLAWLPGTTGALHWLPTAALSIGQAYFTEDPRIGVASGAQSGPSAPASPFERSHSAQLVLEKAFSATDFRITLGQTTTTATLAKIDPDVGLPQNLGPGTLRFVTISARRQFSFGSLQGVVSKADARDSSTGLVTPEAPRTIFDGLAALDRLPGGFHARGEYEYVGHKLLDVGGFEAVPVGETRLALVRPLISGKLELGANAMFGRGYTGQTTETFAPNWRAGGAPPSCAGGVSGVANNFDCGTVERSAGVRLPSYIGASVSWRFGAEK